MGKVLRMKTSNAMLETVLSTAEGNPVQRPLELNDIVVKTVLCFVAVVAGAFPGWMYLASNMWLYLGVVVVLMGAGIVMARKAPVSALIALGYALILGLVVGAFSASAVAYGGSYQLVGQAVVGTLAGFIAMLILYTTPFGKKAAKATKLFLAVILGYFLFGVVNVVLALLGVGDGWGIYGMGAMGLVVAGIGIALASWSVLMDIGMIDEGVSSQIDSRYGWTFAVSLTSSLVWLYLELLRTMSIANR